MQPVKLYLISSNPPAATSGPCVNKGDRLNPDELQQNFINLADGVNKLVGEANSQEEENTLFAAGYRFVVRLDLISGYAPTNTPPTATIQFSNFSAVDNVSPTATILFDNFA
jgi:hypothetical protein